MYLYMLIHLLSLLTTWDFALFLGLVPASGVEPALKELHRYLWSGLDKIPGLGEQTIASHVHDGNEAESPSSNATFLDGLGGAISLSVTSWTACSMPGPLVLHHLPQAVDPGTQLRNISSVTQSTLNVKEGIRFFENGSHFSCYSV